ncbi:MAG: GNAT family N-acetyltransferase [Fusicatenibacter sp.]|nr:GNAT family N-acetyltransferase [Fusicatenibacter sp.]
MTNFVIRHAEVEEIPLISDLIHQVWSSMEKKEWFSVDCDEFTRELLLSGRGTGYLAEEEETGRVAGVFTTEIPGRAEHNLGRDIRLKEEELLLVAHMDSVAVLSEFRGHHLQYRLMQAAEADLKNQGMRYLMCTVHPENRYSLKNAQSQGYRIMATKEKYGGKLRHILLKDLMESE